MRDNIKSELARFCRRMYERGLVAGKEGNGSARADDDTVWVTPTDINKGDVTEDVLVRIDMEGRVVEGAGEPTSERFVHLEFYRRRGDVRAVMHGHPPFSTAFAAARRPLPTGILPELIATISDIALVPYGTAASPELARAIAPYCRGHHAFLLQNHGSLAVGGSVEEAYYRLEVVEAYAKTVWAAEALGGARPLRDDQIADLPRATFV